MGVREGYKQTEVGVIPEEWSVRRFDDLAEIHSGGTPKSNNPLYFGGSIPWFSISDMTSQGKYVTRSGRTLTQAGVDNSPAKVFPIESILYAIYASIGEVAISQIEFTTSQAILAIRTKPLINNAYVYFRLQYIKSEVVKMGQQGTQNNLSAEIVRGFKLPLPPLPEQKAIAAALSDTDDLIAGLEALVAKKRAIKQGAMQQLLTGRKRLPGFTGEWEEKRLGDLTSISSGGTPNTQVNTYWDGEIRWMSSGDLNLKFVNEVDGRITLDGLQNSSAKMVPKGCILIGLAGQGKTRGTVAINHVELSTNQSIASVWPSNQYSSSYLYYNLDSRYEELRSLSTGDGGRGGLNLTILANLPVPYPTLPEQQAIAAVLSDMDAEIESLQTQLGKTRALKQGMMQELLTGRIRLV